MRIGIDARLWNETGVGRYIRNLVQNLGKIDAKNAYTLFLKQEEYESVPLPGKNFTKVLADVMWHGLAEQVRFKQIVEKEKLDLVHFPYFSYPIGIQTKFVITIHDLIIDHFPTGKASTLFSPFYFLKTLGYHMVLKSAINHAQKIITVSGATKGEIIDHYHADPEKILVTPEGIDTAFLQEKDLPAGRQAEKVDVPKKYFLYVGNVYPHKNVSKLLDAFALMQKENSDAHIIFVGKEDYFSKKVEQEVLTKNIVQVLFYHHINDRQLSFLYQHAIALVTPSLMEGFGLPALEAMAHTCLVLASEIPAFLEVCGDVPLYFDPYNTKDIAEKLQVAYKGEVAHIQQKKSEGLKRAKTFSWKKMAQQTLEIYQSVRK